MIKQFIHFPKRLLSSKYWILQYLGASLSSLWTLGFVAIAILDCFVWRFRCCSFSCLYLYRIWIVSGICLILFFGLCSHISRKLMPIFSLRKQETRITWSQILVLFSFGLLLVGILAFIDLHATKKTSDYMSITIIGAVMGWIFQDTIKSVVAFFYLRANDLIHTGDWIELKSHGVDGMLKMITLTTATVENWDTTTSSFPTYLLHSQHLQNYQRMADGKTHGRKMQKKFIIDTSWIHTLTKKDVDNMIERLKEHNQLEFIMEEDFQEGSLNIELYRKYIYHWLMRHPKVSHAPRLVVRWLEHSKEGLPLQIYAFITDTSLTSFEWQQSQIVEHIIRSLEWFDLQLFQSPSAYDSGNSNIYLAPQSANYRKEK